VRVLRGVAGRLGGELVVSRHGEQRLRAQIADLRVEAAADPEPPHRLTSLRMYPVAARVTDPRTAGESSVRTAGAVPEWGARVAEESHGELGLPGLVIGGSCRAAGSPGRWPGAGDLDGPEALRTEHRFPAYGVAKLVTSTAVLRLAPEARVDLDAPANGYLNGIRLADDGVTVRELLTHTGGVTGPSEPFADRVPDLVDVLGATVPVDGWRGTLVPGNAGYAVLGQLIADVTGAPFPAAVTALVLLPLGMHSSSFPSGWPDTGAVTGYRLTDDGSYVDAPRQVSVMPAAGRRRPVDDRGRPRTSRPRLVDAAVRRAAGRGPAPARGAARGRNARRAGLARQPVERTSPDTRAPAPRGPCPCSSGRAPARSASRAPTGSCPSNRSPPGSSG
jgi:hypothetical protein